MKIEFNEDGSLKLPEDIEKARKEFKLRVRKADENPNKVIVDYEEVVPGYEDNWLITLPKDISKDILFTLQKWANAQHKIISGSTWINQEDNNSFILIVKGDRNRCTWAHAFLNGLNTALIRDYHTNIKQTGTCNHKFYVKKYF